VGVNSGRSAKGACPVSFSAESSASSFPEKTPKISETIPSPLLTVYSSRLSNVGPSISSNPCRIAVSRHAFSMYRRRKRSAG
jgi:hypothetical protein